MKKLSVDEPGDVDYLAELLHESGREAVEKLWVVRKDVPVMPFIEWKDLPTAAMEGRRSMARFILGAGRPWAFMVEEVCLEEDAKP
jgi:hypothetical protein